MRHAIWLTVLLAALTAGCAESTAIPEDDDDSSSDSDSDSDSDTDTDTDSDSDTDTDTDSDTDTDTDSDTDSDTDTDTGSSTECECFNAEIDCCDGCYYEGTDVVCEPDYEWEAGCPWGSDCGSSVGVRTRARYCPGDVAACIGEVGDWSDWEEFVECGPVEVCDDVDFICTPDLVTCPVSFGDQVCVAGGFMPDCGLFGCGDPPPSLTEILSFADLGVGEVVRLDIDTPIRGTGLFNPGLPFTDITMTLTHGSTVSYFYNHYQGIDLTVIWPSYEFPSTWFLPHFWGEEMGGTWTLYVEDHANSLGPFDLLEWCVTFLDPATTSAVTSGTWSGGDTGDIWGSDTPPATSYFELQIDDIADGSTGTPTLSLSASHPTPTDLEIVLVAPDGTEHMVKAQAAASIPTTYDVTGMDTGWLTGRWQLKCTNHATLVDGSVSSWSISL